MRVTQQMLHQNSVRHMNQNLSRFEKLNNQVSSGKQLQRPSDDPYGVSKSMNLKSAIAANEQYDRNTTEAKLWLDETDQTINQVVNVMQRARELAVKGNSDTLTDHDREAIASEVEELSKQIHQFANAKVNGNHLFNGKNEPPFPDDASYLAPPFASETRTFTIADGVAVKGNVSAQELFGEDGNGPSLFQIMDNLVAGIRSGESIDLEQVDVGMDRMLTKASEIGARTNRVEAIENRVKDGDLALQSMLSKLEDINYAEALTKLKSEESIYQASLASSAKVIQQSLLDFLR